MYSLVKECKKCLFDDSEPGISVDIDGFCNICDQTNNLIDLFGTGQSKGQQNLLQMVKSMKKDGKHSKYDCIIGVSGGVDSSFLVHLAVNEWKLRPLLAHYDNTWNTAAASQNIFQIARQLNLDLDTLVLNNKESDDFVKAFFCASVPELDAATDLGYAYYLRKLARKERIKYVLEAHSFMEEGVTPLNNNYFDGRYIKDIHKKFGKNRIKTYPLMTFNKFIYATIFARVKFIRPLWYIDYKKESAKKLLRTIYNWEDYGGNHLENRITFFFHSVYLPRKFSMVTKKYFLSAQVRNGSISRKDALKVLLNESSTNADSIQYFRERLDISQNDFDQIMNQEGKSSNEFKTYKKLFELLKPFFWILAKKNLVTMSFYVKYCNKRKKND